MPTRTRLALAVVGVLCTLAFGASLANASRAIEVRGLEAGRGVTASGALALGETEVERRLVRGNTVTCNVTLLRTIENRISKTAGTSFGKVTGVAIDIASCREGENIPNVTDVTALRDPDSSSCREIGRERKLCDTTGGRAAGWELIYDSFQGTLPRIEGINFHINNVQFLFLAFLSCLYSGTAFGLIAIDRTGTVTGATAVLERTALARSARSSGLCPIRTGTFSGAFAVSPRLTIALI